MSFQRSLIAALATLGLVTSVYAADPATTDAANATNAPGATTTTTTQTTSPSQQDVTVASNGSSSTDANANQAAPNTDKAQQQQQGDASSAKVNLNTADAKTLTQIKGITPKKAKAIIEYRTKNGQFASVQDLCKVKGFSKKAVSKLQEQLTVG